MRVAALNITHLPFPAFLHQITQLTQPTLVRSFQHAKMCKYGFFALKMIVHNEARPEAHGKCRLFAAAAAAGASRDASGTVGDHHLKKKNR